MILSVVIVNYNVKFFLEQCLSSLRKAIAGISVPGPVEVFIIDNASSDGSFEFLHPLYPEFQFIRNEENLGFAKACNQGLSQCQGEFILFLNPDTILPEDSLDKCLLFFKTTPDAGAMGVKMVDGAGRYLRESKRGFPGLRNSFFKMTGLTTLFPRSKFFAAYYMGELHEGSTHPVEILSGAFMLIRGSVLKTVGAFDERFFMYAEDIDLSYRLLQSGFRNYYFSGVTIIHFKGESTQKDFRYVKTFYGAMNEFMKKHLHGAGGFMRRAFATIGMRMQQFIHFLLVPFIKREPIPVRPLKIYIQADPEEQKFWQQKLATENIPYTEIENSGEEEILFCEGAGLSWKMIIKKISDQPGRLTYSFHGSGTHAVVSSLSSRRQGVVFE
jgi:N-acetylglucosaminyl-diphospho-decaprenol L-rhamnosyltransferase